MMRRFLGSRTLVSDGAVRQDVPRSPTTEEAVMSASSAPHSAPRVEGRSAAYERHGSGWVTFAGTMLALVGTMNVIYGIGAIDSANVFVGDARYIVSDLNTWGWFLCAVGALQVVAAFSIWNGTGWGRWIGVGSAGLNAILQLLWLPAFPFLALALFTLDILVIYGLIAHGDRRATV